MVYTVLTDKYTTTKHLKNLSDHPMDTLDEEIEQIAAFN
jgi:hypothetical protein